MVRASRLHFLHTNARSRMQVAVVPGLQPQVSQIAVSTGTSSGGRVCRAHDLKPHKNGYVWLCSGVDCSSRAQHKKSRIDRLHAVPQDGALQQRPCFAASIGNCHARPVGGYWPGWVARRREMRHWGSPASRPASRSTTTRSPAAATCSLANRAQAVPSTLLRCALQPGRSMPRRVCLHLPATLSRPSDSSPTCSGLTAGLGGSDSVSHSRTSSLFPVFR